VIELGLEGHGAYAVVRPLGLLDTSTAAGFRQAAADVAGEQRVLIDLSTVTFLDADGLNAVVCAVGGIRQHGGRAAVVVGTRNGADEVLHAAGLDRLVAVTPSIDEAVDRLLGRDGRHGSPT
jgi:anti-anti-sigma factor